MKTVNIFTVEESIFLFISNNFLSQFNKSKNSGT
jgi:hypothetical protein